MNPVNIITKKRDGQRLSDDEIRDFIQGFVRGDVADYQAAAWAMAVYFQGMDAAETTALTLAIAESGDQLDLHDALPAGTIIVDKHSSGGVGDKTTLAVAPIVAACGLPVGKMSGRGLSFTGGTIDKLESIAGWSPNLSEAQFRRQLAEIGLVVAGQTAELAPADKQLYALRDVTATVDSLPLICSSIMGKKLAAGADAIVLDVKCGRGAFMETLDDARELAQLMVDVGALSGRRVTALITQMAQPLGRAVGNTLEVQEAIATLRGEGPDDFGALVEEIAAEMIVLGGSKRLKVADWESTSPPQASTFNLSAAKQAVRDVINSGAALAKFREFVAAQGGDPSLVDAPDRLPSAPVQIEVMAERAGWVSAIDAREVGLAVVALGGGRQKKGEAIDHRVGAVLAAKVGTQVAAGDSLCLVHAADEGEAMRAVIERVRAAFGLSDEAVEPLPVVYERISK